MFSVIFVLFLAGNVLFYYRYYNVREEEKLNALAFIQVHFCGRCLAAEYFSKVTLLRRVIKYVIIFLPFECADYDFLRMKYRWGGFLTLTVKAFVFLFEFTKLMGDFVNVAIR